MVSWPETIFPGIIRSDNFIEVDKLILRPFAGQTTV